jgi:hypothetical protein
MRSEDGTEVTEAFPGPETPEVKAVKAYPDWLSKGLKDKLPWRGRIRFRREARSRERPRPRERRSALPREMRQCHG